MAGNPGLRAASIRGMTAAMAPADLPPGYGPRARGVPLKQKLMVATIAANLAGMMAAVYLANVIRAVPDSASTESILVAAYWTALCVVAVVDALLVDELMFRGAFRLTHLQGKDARFARPTDDAEMVAATMQRSNVSFPIVLLLCGGLTYLVFNFVNRDFNSYYRRIGVHVSALRGDDPEGLPRRLQAIAELSVRRDPKIVPTLHAQLARGGEVGAWAAWAMGRFIDAKSERSAILSDLRAVVRAADPAIKREAVISLARYQDRDIADALTAELRKDLEAGPIDRRLLIAAGHIQVPSVIPALAEVLARGDERAQRVAAWAIAQHRDQRDAKDLDKLLADRLPSASILVRCAIVHSLWIVGNEAGNLPLMHAWDSATPAELETTCPPETVYLSPDGKQDFYDIYLPVNVYSTKILEVMGQLRATTPEIRAKVEPWLEALAKARDGDGTLVSSRARSLLEGIRGRRDDSGAAAPK